MATDEAADTIIYGAPDLSELEQEWDVPFMYDNTFRINAAVAETASLKKLAGKLRVSACVCVGAFTPLGAWFSASMLGLC